MLNVNNISLILERNVIVENLSFQISEGILTILGLNGSGKTTLLKAIAGLVQISSGDILFDEKSINSFSRSDLSKVVAFVPQEYSTVFNFTVEEIVIFGRAPHIKTFSFPSKLDTDIVHNIMYEMNIYELKQRKFNNLSGGERRLVLLAMALAQDTKILLLDEPTAFLDIKNSFLLIKKIVKLASIYKKVIIVTMHDINQSLLFSDKILMLFALNKYKMGSIKEMISEDSLRSLYHIDFSILRTEDDNIFVSPKF